MTGLRGDLNKFKEIVQQTRVDWQTCEFFGGYSVLHLAAVEGNLDILRFLIENEGCNPSPKTSLGRTPLHLAAQHGRLEVVRYLVCECLVDPSEQDNNRLTALHHACTGGNLEIVTFLMNEMNIYVPANSVVVEKTALGDTVLHLAAQSGHVNIIKFLHQLQGLNINPHLKGQYDYTPLHYAAINGHAEVIRYLLDEWHCNPNCKTKK